MRISIVEENQILLENLEFLLTGEPNYEIVGPFLSAEYAMQAIHNDPPEVLLTDLAFPGMTGIELMGKVKQKYPEIDVMPTLFLTVVKTSFRQYRLAHPDISLMEAARSAILPESLEALADRIR